MKLVLTITSGSLSGERYELTTGFMSIGRGQNCTVRFDPTGERIASKQHAFIEATPEGYMMTDNNSTNGTLVNSHRIQQATLNSGDTVQFGRNGITAQIIIQEDGTEMSTLSRNEFRDLQIERFEELAVREPVSVQGSFSGIGMGGPAIAYTAPESEKAAGSALFYIGLTLTILAMVFCALLVSALTLLSLGPTAAVIATTAAFIPALFYVLPLMWLDRYDPEPLWLLALAFAWGAIISIFVSLIFNTAIGAFVGNAISPEAGMFASAVISAPIFEESSKGIGLLLILWAFRKYFDDILDGIVFGGVIALGFATVENVMYYGESILKGGIAGLFVIMILRGILSPFIHVFFTAMTGIGCGIARETHKTWLKILAPIVGYIFAVALHALWNFLALMGGYLLEEMGLSWLCTSSQILSVLGNVGGVGLCAFGLSYTLLQVPLFLIFVGFALYIMRRQSKILRDMLAIDVARGLIYEDHLKIATSAFRSTAWRLGGIFSGKYNSRRKYLRAIGSLGLSYWHIQRATAAAGQTASFQQNPVLREEVLKWRDQV